MHEGIVDRGVHGPQVVNALSQMHFVQYKRHEPMRRHDRDEDSSQVEQIGDDSTTAALGEALSRTCRKTR